MLDSEVRVAEGGEALLEGERGCCCDQLVKLCRANCHQDRARHDIVYGMEGMMCEKLENPT